MPIKKKIFKAIVIDDESVRNKTYIEVLENKFEVEILNEIFDISRDKIMKCDLLVIDICLSKNVESLTAFKIMDDYNLTLPTVIVSSEWINEKGEPNDFILQVPKYKNIIKVISWNDFNKEDANSKISEDIFYEFCKIKNFAMSKNKDIYRILHISDLQFGGNASGASCNDNARIAAFLLENEIRPDLIIVTGDIADKGKKSEFDEALVWLQELAKLIWKVEGKLPQEYKDRFIIVPGNHDYNLSINASDNYEFTFGADKINTFKKKPSNSLENQKLGFYNFMKFAYELTGDISWLNYVEKPLYKSEKFINWGIRLYMLNSVYGINNTNCENRFDKFYCDLSSVQEKNFNMMSISNDSICNILVMHNAPENFRIGTEAGEKSWNRFQVLVEDNRINACLYGHTHDFNTARRLRDNGGRCCKKLLCISAPSVRLAAASRTEDADRGFNIIELNKIDGVIANIKPRYFSMKKASISEIEDEEDSFSI